MKVNFQKIFVAFSAVCIMSCFAVSVYATDVNGGISSGGGGSNGNRTDFGNVLEVYANNLGEYVNGNITIDEFLTTSGKIIDEAEDEFANRMGYGYINSIHENFVNGFWDNVADAESYIRDILNSYSSTGQQSTTDMHGYGACVKFYEYYNDSVVSWVWYGSYGTYECIDTLKNYYRFTIYSPGVREHYLNNKLNATIEITSNSYGASGYEVQFFGDWRNPNNTEENLPTNDEYVEIPTYDFSNASDKELEELLKELNETLEIQQPDLSTMEGLLESIYYRLGTLDSDNDNALLSQVITAIQFSSGELKSVLEEIRDSLTDGVSGDNSDLAEKLEKMITTDDFIIDEEAYRNYSTVLKLRLEEKFIFADDLKNLVVYAFDKYAISSENPQLELSYNSNTYIVDLNVYNEYMPTIRFMIAAFTYVSFALHTYRKIPSYINGGDNL